MTRLTAEFKSNRRYRILRFRGLKKLKGFQNSPHHIYTNFSGNYGQSLTREKLSENLKYAEAVRRQKFW